MADGRILAVGAGARGGGGIGRRGAPPGRHAPTPVSATPTCTSSWMARAAAGVDLVGTTTRAQTLARVAASRAARPAGAWIEGSGWRNDDWADDPRPLTRDGARRRRRRPAGAAGPPRRPLRVPQLARPSPPPASRATRRTRRAASSIATRPASRPAWCARRRATIAQRARPRAGRRRLRRRAPLGPAGAGAPRVSPRCTPWTARRCSAACSACTASGGLPIRVVWNLPVDQLGAAESLGIASGVGDAWLRIWGVKVFLDGSLGSRTAEMLDGERRRGDRPGGARRHRRGGAQPRASTSACTPSATGRSAARSTRSSRCAARGTMWRPRIEHAQCVDPADVPALRAHRRHRLDAAGARGRRPCRRRRAVAGPHRLRRMRGARCSGPAPRSRSARTRPVEDPSPLRGIDAATTWRARAGWHPELAISRERGDPRLHARRRLRRRDGVRGRARSARGCAAT